jgi:hypothetical protein
MNFQTPLLLLIAYMIGKHWYPDYVYPAIAIGLALWALNELPKWWQQRKIERAKQKTLDADAPLRDEFWRKHKVIRDKYDPKHEWNEGTSLPFEYRREMDELNAEYRSVMDRWHNQ